MATRNRPILRMPSGFFKTHKLTPKEAERINDLLGLPQRAHPAPDVSEILEKMNRNIAAIGKAFEDCGMAANEAAAALAEAFNGAFGKEAQSKLLEEFEKQKQSEPPPTGRRFRFDDDAD